MSGYPKILWPITVPSGDWDFGFNDGAPRVATIPADTYQNIFDIAEQLQSAMNVASAVNFVVDVSSIGTVTIDGDAAWNTAWGTTDADCSACFGFRETEAVGGGNILTALDAHLYGYYPGTISYGRSTARGAGLTSALRWEPDCHEVRNVAGNRVSRAVAVATPQDTTELSCSLIKCDSVGAGADEWHDVSRGVRAWRLACSASQFYLFPDRYVGTVVSWNAATLVEGTDYYTLAFAGQLRGRAGPHPSFCTWSVPVNWELGP
jgi:hypothetical protein